jgi:hypothetical protein
MKRLTLVLTFALAAGALAWTVGFRTTHQPVKSIITADDQELEWLRRKFNLSDAQFVRIQKLHQDYAPICEELCGKIATCHRREQELMSLGAEGTPEFKTAREETNAVRAECQKHLRAHLARVTAEMNPDQARAYRAFMQPRVMDPGNAVHEP